MVKEITCSVAVVIFFDFLVSLRLLRMVIAVAIVALQLLQQQFRE